LRSLHLFKLDRGEQKRPETLGIVDTLTFPDIVFKPAIPARIPSASGRNDDTSSSLICGGNRESDGVCILDRASFNAAERGLGVSLASCARAVKWAPWNATTSRKMNVDIDVSEANALPQRQHLSSFFRASRPTGGRIDRSQIQWFQSGNQHLDDRQCHEVR